MAEWQPKVGDLVWLNYPDSPEPEGKVVGFVEHGVRVGQPIIESIKARPEVFGRGERAAGDRFVIHTTFLLPFRYGGKEWQKAKAEGRIG